MKVIIGFFKGGFLCGRVLGVGGGVSGGWCDTYILGAFLEAKVSEGFFKL